MPINNLATKTLFQQILDKQMVQLSITGWMEPNASLVKYKGGREVKVPKISMDGLGDYDRDEGYAQGAITMEYETRTMTMDRGRKFHIDAMDVDETGFVTTAATIAGEFQRTKVIPEVDAYRISTIAKLAGESRMRAYTPAANSIFGNLLDDIATVQDKAGEDAQLVILMSIPVATLLSKSSEYSKQIDMTAFNKGGLESRVRSIDGIPILRSTSGLMKTGFDFLDGRADDEKAGGFKAAAGAVDINWMVIMRNAPMAISKTDLPRIFDPNINQGGNAWRIDYRKYHDLWILDNALDGVFVNVKTMPTVEP